MKHEIRIEFPNAQILSNLIEKAYFEQGLSGKIINKEHHIIVDEKSDDVLHTILKGLNNATVKLINPDVIDGTMRFMVDETTGQVRLYPISIYCIKETDKYTFY
jgi:hypothetical protein